MVVCTGGDLRQMRDGHDLAVAPELFHQAPDGFCHRAACADNHWVVSKQSDKQGSFSAVETVNGEQRVSEIARMLGGERLSDTTHAHAREMLQTMASASTAKAKTRAAKT